jgi:hypothetical protein
MRETMNSNEAFARDVQAVKIRLKEKFGLIEDIARFDATLFRKLVAENIDMSQTRIEIDSLENAEIHDALGLSEYSDQLVVVDKNLSMLSFSVAKRDFVSNFDDFFYPGDDLLILDASSQKVVCWIDHEEFAVLPTSPRARG